MAPTVGISWDPGSNRLPSGADPRLRPLLDQASAASRLRLLLVDVADDVFDVVVLVLFGEEGVILFLLDFLFLFVAALNLDGAAGGGLVVGLLEADGLDRILLDLDLDLDRGRSRLG